VQIFSEHAIHYWNCERLQALRGHGEGAVAVGLLVVVLVGVEQSLVSPQQLLKIGDGRQVMQLSEDSRQVRL